MPVLIFNQFSTQIIFSLSKIDKHFIQEILNITCEPNLTKRKKMSIMSYVHKATIDLLLYLGTPSYRVNKL